MGLFSNFLRSQPVETPKPAPPKAPSSAATAASSATGSPAKSLHNSKTRRNSRATAKSEVGTPQDLTPRALTDPTFQGDQSRTGMLEKQIVEISKAATEAYDKMDEMKTKASMLEEQVTQQKELIQSLMAELEEEKMKTRRAEEASKTLTDKLDAQVAANKTLEETAKSAALDAAAAKSRASRDSQSSNTTNATSTSSNSNNISNLSNISGPFTPATSVSASPNSTMDFKQQGMEHLVGLLGRPSTQSLPSPTLSMLSGDQGSEVTHLNKKISGQAEIISSQSRSIDELRARVKELELQSEQDDKEYEDTLNRLKSSMLAITANRKFLGSVASLPEQGQENEFVPRPRVFSDRMSRFGGYDDGETYVVEKLSPFM